MTSSGIVFAAVCCATSGLAVAGPAVSEKQALAELKAIGGVLVHYDDRAPDRPVVLIDFTNHAQFREQWLNNLAAFPRLSGLGLAGTTLGDAGLRHLRGLTALETLSLAQTQVTDEGLVELLGLKRLRHLDVRGTQVTAAGVAALRKYLPDLEVDFGAAPGGATAQPAPPDEARRSTVIALATIVELRRKAAELSAPVEGRPEPQGWSKSRVDPGQLVEIFKPLRLRTGYVLRAYVFREEGNGNGVVWALPADAEFPAPQDCPTLESHMLKAPKPSDALDDAMEAIEGDGSAWSYMAASLLRRELLEFGALWHGCRWNTHFVLGEDPWKAGPPKEGDSPMEHPTSSVEQWKWLETRPTDWRPQVRMEGDRVSVVFYTYSGLSQEGVFRHTDTYRVGKYRPRTQEKRIGEGPSGYAF
jgi:hypothetical protein